MRTRQSEDLDFMRWKQGPKDKLEVGWPAIKKELSTIGMIESEDIQKRCCHSGIDTSCIGTLWP